MALLWIILHHFQWKNVNWNKFQQKRNLKLIIWHCGKLWFVQMNSIFKFSVRNWFVIQYSLHKETDHFNVFTIHCSSSISLEICCPSFVYTCRFRKNPKHSSTCMFVLEWLKLNTNTYVDWMWQYLPYGTNLQLIFSSIWHEWNFVYKYILVLYPTPTYTMYIVCDALSVAKFQLLIKLTGMLKYTKIMQTHLISLSDFSFN